MKDEDEDELKKSQIELVIVKVCERFVVNAA